jgi:hypothetical protein
MVCIRQATVDDLISMQNTNLWCLPENYQVRSAPTHRVALTSDVTTACGPCTLLLI